MHQQIKVFSCHTIQELEKQVNQWLTDNPAIEVLQFRQSESGGGGMEWFITFTVLFKKIGDRR